MLQTGRSRWALIGNAVTVTVGKWLGESLMLAHRHKYLAGAKDEAFPQVPSSGQSYFAAQEKAFQVSHASNLGEIQQSHLPFFEILLLAVERSSIPPFFLDCSRLWQFLTLTAEQWAFNTLAAKLATRKMRRPKPIMHLLQLAHPSKSLCF